MKTILFFSLVLSFVLYANGLNGEFVTDDKLVILQNPLISGHPDGIGKIFLEPYYYGQPHAGLYRPLTIVSYFFNKFFSDGPLGFHLLNLILNGVNVLLVFILVSKLASKKTAYIAAALFAFLPIHSEAVSSIVGRAELLSFLFSATSLIFVLDRRYIPASLALLAGLLSKETAAGFFLIFLYLWKFYEGRTLKQVLINSVYFVLPVTVYGILRVHVLGKYFMGVEHLMAYNPLRFASFLESLWTSLNVLYLYVFKTIIPINLSFDYSFNQIPIINNPLLSYEFYLGAAILAVLAYLMFKKRSTTYGLSAAIFLLAYLPVSNWFVKIGTIMGERLMYAPSLGLTIIAAVFLGRLLENKNIGRKIILPILVVACGAYGFVVIDRNQDWRSEESLIRSAYSASPNSVVVITDMAYLDFNSKNYKSAREWADKALAIVPSHTPALYIAGHSYKKLDDFKKAESSWLQIIKIDPTYIKAYLSLGILYYEELRFSEAELVLEKGFGLKKRWNEAFPLALVKINLGKHNEAINLVTANFGQNPEKRELKFVLGLAYLKIGDKQKAGTYLAEVKEPSVHIEDFFKSVENKKVFKIEEY